MKKNSTMAVCLDLSKAFDSVDHDILNKKIQSYGIRGVALELIKSYLLNRKQCVIETDNTGVLIKSDIVLIERGVPQGSILGPLLYVLYTNDLPSMVDVKTIMYADDTSLIIGNTNVENLIQTVTAALDSLEGYFCKNSLKLNKEKTQIINFTYQKDNNEVILTSGNDIIRSVNSTSFLGVKIDSRLNWKTHIDHVSQKVAKYCYALKVIAQNIDIPTAFMAYYAYVQSQIKYGIVFWGNSSEAVRIFVLQKRCIRNILNMKQTETCKQMFIEKRILTLASLYIFEVIIFIKQNINLFVNFNLSHLYSTRNKNNLVNENIIKYSYIQKNVPYSLLGIYNKLPISIKNLSNKDIKIKLNQILIEKAYYTIDEFLEDNII